MAEQLRHAGSLAVLFPVLSLIGRVLLCWLGLQGVLKRRTIASYRTSWGLSERSYTVTGASAVVTGVIYLFLAVLLAVVMVPVSAAMIGLW